MGALSNGGFWWNFPAGEGRGDRCKRRQNCKSSSSDSINLREERGWPHFDFPVKQAAIAASLALTGDTIAQLRDRIFGRGRSQLDGDAKVILNQIVLGPCVIAVIFAWNNLWLGKLSELPAKYQNDALPTLLYGFRFWIPVTILNFGIVPLPARVAFMSTCSIFWNFYLSSTMSR
ncbi:hypothetical protein IEQ34_020641 [Dendrobium chrysotoxum]|uniref:Uncharacterized protein n=1 Tax=Dendrobium chrysotoxum TaxID=161865 RepID=A0AAV7G1K3_DENCH|nr:hypothetical protein IEQ34_020641 [Dendrobium chrysotoxum]